MHADAERESDPYVDPGSRVPSLSGIDLLVLAHGYQTFTKNQADVLADRCDSVTVLARYNRFADLGEHVPIDYLQPHSRSARIDRTDQPPNVTVIPVPIYYLPFEFSYRRLGRKHLRRVRSILDERDVSFDLVHAHFTWTAGYAGVRLGAHTDTPCVLTVHENENWLRDLHASDRRQVHDTWRNADAVVRVNRKDVPLLAEYNDAVYSVPNGFTRDEFPRLDRDDARAAVGVPDDADLVFGLGGLNDRKRFRHLVTAMREVADRRDGVRCAIAGQGSRKSALRAQVSEVGLDDVVSILGYVPQDELAQWMNAADVFALSSVSEGNPTVMFEALGCGTPYVGTDVGGVSEVVTPGEHGLLCGLDDPAALADVIDEGLDRDWDRDAIASYGSEFTWERVVDRIAAVYSDVHPSICRGVETGAVVDG